MPLVDVIERFNPQTLTVRRVSAGRIVDGYLVPVDEIDDEVDLDGATNTLTLDDHGLASGAGPFKLEVEDGDPPSGLTADAYYWVIVLDDDTLQLAASYASAVATPTPFPINFGPSFTFVAEADDDTLTKVAHGFATGDGPVRVSNTGGALPAGLLSTVDYWIIALDVDTFQLASSQANALLEVAIDLTTDGTGVQTLAYDDTDPLATFSLVAPESFPIRAGVQEMSGRDMEDNPEGQSGTHELTLFTRTLVFPRMPPSGANPGREPDEVLITWLGQSEWWTVMNVKQYRNISDHYVVTVERSVMP